MKRNLLHLRRILGLGIALASSGQLLAQAPASQEPVPVRPPVLQPGQASVPRFPVAVALPETSEPLFDLEFPGGTLAEFVEAISKARGKPVNVIFSKEDMDTPIPGLKMHQVDVSSVLKGLSSSSAKTYNLPRENPGGGTYFERVNYGYTFSPLVSGDSTVWVFVRQGVPIEKAEPAPPTVTVRFYNLEPYLERNTVEDITTALNTGHQLRTGMTDRLNLKFHKETKLLIVRGTPQELALIDDALRQLRPPEPPTPKAESQPKPAKSGVF